MNEPYQPQPATWVVQTIVAATRLTALSEPRAVDQILEPSITAHRVKLERRCDESSIYDRNCQWNVLAWVPGRVLASTASAGLSVRHLGRRSSAIIEQGREPDPHAKERRARMLAQALRKLGYEVTITPVKLATAENGIHM